MEAGGWRLLFHDCLAAQLARLSAAARRAEGDPHNANVRLFARVSRLILETIPDDPARDIYRLGNTLGTGHRHWRRARIGERFRLFFRYDAAARMIVYVWINDQHTLRQRGGQPDPYTVFAHMLESGDPPDGWDVLVARCRDAWPGA